MSKKKKPEPTPELSEQEQAEQQAREQQEQREFSIHHLRNVVAGAVQQLGLPATTAGMMLAEISNEYRRAGVQMAERHAQRLKALEESRESKEGKGER